METTDGTIARSLDFSVEHHLALENVDLREALRQVTQLLADECVDHEVTRRFAEAEYRERCRLARRLHDLLDARRAASARQRAA